MVQLVGPTFSKPPPIPRQSRPSLPRTYLPASTPSRDWSSFRRARSLTPLRSRESSPVLSRSRISLRDSSPCSYSSRDTSPFTSVGSSRESSPYRSTSSISSNHSYLRTSYACKYPYVKSVTLGQVPQILHFGVDTRLNNVIWESVETFCLTSVQNNKRKVIQSIQNNNVFQGLKIPQQRLTFLLDTNLTNETKDIKNNWSPYFQKAMKLEQRSLNYLNLACQEITFFNDYFTKESNFYQIPKSECASKSEQTSSQLELIHPTKLLTHNPLLMLKKAILPKIKYRWEEGFRQGPVGWTKVPLLKLKFKYKEDELELVPPRLSVEGGRWCETKKLDLDQGRGRVKLKSSQGAKPQIRVVPLGRDGNQDYWVPEFLFSVETPHCHTEDKSTEEKWCKVKLSPAIPE